MNIHAKPNPQGASVLFDDIDRLGPRFAERAARYDDTDRFVNDNYHDLKAIRYFSAGIPVELGGSGASYTDICAATRKIARFCGSTALATAMHQHSVQQLLFRWRRGGSDALAEKLRHVAQGQLVMVTSGASDWLEPSGNAVKVEGGYRVSGRKIFASGSPAGAVLSPRAPYTDDNGACTIIHFTLPLDEPSVTIAPTWEAQGMRGTGSNDVLFKNYFVADDAIALTRPYGAWDQALEIPIGCALPIVMSAYLGLAESAYEIAMHHAHGEDDLPVIAALGEMTNALEAAALAVDGMIALADEGHFEPSIGFASKMVTRKTLATRAVIETVEKAVDVVGGAAYFRRHPLERLQRDVRAARFHPMQEKRQLVFTGRHAAGLSPA